MKPIITSTMLLLSAAAFSITGCVTTEKAPDQKPVPSHTGGGSSETPSKKHAGRKPANEAWGDGSDRWALTTQQGAHGGMYHSWVMVDQGVWEATMPNGHKYIWTEKWGDGNAFLGGTMALSNGKKFVVQMSPNAAQNTKDSKLILPNGQTFATEGPADFPLVSDDGALVVHDAAALHLYLRRANGQYREIPDAKGQIDKLLKRATGVGAGEMILVSLGGRTHRTLNFVSGDSPKSFWFKVNVGSDGTLSLLE